MRRWTYVPLVVGLIAFIFAGWIYLHTGAAAGPTEGKQGQMPGNVTVAASSTGKGVNSTPTPSPSPTPTPPPKPAPPAAPTGLSITPGVTHVSLYWNAAPRATRYEIYRGRTDKFSSAAMATSTSNTTAVVYGLLPDVHYYFWVASKGVGGTTRPVQMAQATTYVGWQAIENEDRNSIVKIKTYSTALGVFGASDEGTGWVAPGGYIVTCYHMVQSAHYVVDVFLANDGTPQFSGQKYHAQLVGVNKAHDLALLKLENGPSYLRPLPLGGSVYVGERVAQYGHPGGEALTLDSGNVLETGVHESVTGYGHILNMTNTNIPTVGGNSGSPVFNPWGQVVGITESAGLHNGDNAYFVPVEYLAQWNMTGQSTPRPLVTAYK